MDDVDGALRLRLKSTWETLLGRLSASDFPPHVVFETLAEVATEGMAAEFGATAASSMLRLRADAIEVTERDRVSALIAGDDPEPHPAVDGRRPTGSGPPHR